MTVGEPLALEASVRLIIADEPGAWGPTAGRRLWDACATALGKRRTTLIAIGTLAPSPTTGPASWWPSIVASGSGDGRHISLLQADPEKWRDFAEVLKCNPVSAISSHLRKTLEREHEAALKSELAARTFRQYRLNLPGDPVDAQPLITSSEWQRVVERQVPRRARGRQSSGSISAARGRGLPRAPSGRVAE